MFGFFPSIPSSTRATPPSRRPMPASEKKTQNGNRRTTTTATTPRLPPLPIAAIWNESAAVARSGGNARQESFRSLDGFLTVAFAPFLPLAHDAPHLCSTRLSSAGIAHVPITSCRFESTTDGNTRRRWTERTAAQSGSDLHSKVQLLCGMQFLRSDCFNALERDAEKSFWGVKHISFN